MNGCLLITTAIELLKILRIPFSHCEELLTQAAFSTEIHIMPLT